MNELQSFELYLKSISSKSLSIRTFAYPNKAAYCLSLVSEVDISSYDIVSKGHKATIDKLMELKTNILESDLSLVA